jgi:hypothetical protein
MYHGSAAQTALNLGYALRLQGAPTEAGYLTDPNIVIPEKAKLNQHGHEVTVRASEASSTRAHKAKQKRVRVLFLGS